ncbi:MAG: hypothetical protein QOC67_1846, partial [Pseudonocardiales bacterium]|nr:hypothetical protein [Pseudonocardiales bacterium]
DSVTDPAPSTRIPPRDVRAGRSPSHPGADPARLSAPACRRPGWPDSRAAVQDGPPTATVAGNRRPGAARSRDTGADRVPGRPRTSAPGRSPRALRSDLDERPPGGHHHRAGHRRSHRRSHRRGHRGGRRTRRSNGAAEDAHGPWPRSWPPGPVATTRRPTTAPTGRTGPVNGATSPSRPPALARPTEPGHPSQPRHPRQPRRATPANRAEPGHPSRPSPGPPRPPLPPVLVAPSSGIRTTAARASRPGSPDRVSRFR